MAVRVSCRVLFEYAIRISIFTNTNAFAISQHLAAGLDLPRAFGTFNFLRSSVQLLSFDLKLTLRAACKNINENFNSSFQFHLKLSATMQSRSKPITAVLVKVYAAMSL